MNKCRKFGKPLLFKSLTSIVLTLFITAQPLLTQVYADSFYNSNGNVDECSFASVTGIQYNSLGGSGVQWNPSDVSGQSGNWIQSNTITDLADITFPDAHRYSGIGDRVAVPPNTTVDIGLFVWNYTGHDVSVDSVHFFTSRANPSNGDLTRLGADGTMQTTSMNGFPSRTGKRIETGNLGVFNNRTEHPGKVFYSFETILPIQFRDFQASQILSGSNLTIEYTLTLQNISAYPLGNIRVYDLMPSGQTYDQTHSFGAGETKVIRYSENWGSNYPPNIQNDGATVYDNNRHTEIQSEVYPSVTGGNSADMRPAVVMRTDSNSPSGWNAGQPTWGQMQRPPITIELIPYWFNTADVSVTPEEEPEPELEVEKTVTDRDETNVSTNHIQEDYPTDNERSVTFRINVENVGDADAQGVEVRDDVSEILRYGQISNISDGGSLVNNEIIWDVGRLRDGEDETFTFNVQFIKGITDRTNIENIVEATADNAERDEDSTHTIIHSPILDVSKIPNTNPAHPNDRVRWTITVRNTGTGNAYNTEVYDRLPPKMSPIEISDNGAYNEGIREIRWSTTEPHYILNGTYAPDPRSTWGNEKTLYFDVILDPIFPLGTTTHRNIVVAETDNYPSDTYEAPLNVIALPELVIEKYIVNNTAVSENRNYSGEGVSHDEYGADADVIFDSENDVYAKRGDELKYTIVFRNEGTAHAPDVVLKDFLPRFVTYNNTQVEIFRPQDIISHTDDVTINQVPSGYEITWNIGEVQVNDSWKVRELIVRVNPEFYPNIADPNIAFTLDNLAEISSTNTLVESVSDNAIFQAEENGMQILPPEDEEEDDENSGNGDIDVDVIVNNSNNNTNNTSSDNNVQVNQNQEQNQNQFNEQDQLNEQNPVITQNNQDSNQNNNDNDNTNTNTQNSCSDCSTPKKAICDDCLAKTGESILSPIVFGIFFSLTGIFGIAYMFKGEIKKFLAKFTYYQSKIKHDYFNCVLDFFRKLHPASFLQGNI